MTTIPNIKPDIIRDNDKKTCMLIDVAISGDRNMIKKEAEKIIIIIIIIIISLVTGLFFLVILLNQQ